MRLADFRFGFAFTRGGAALQVLEGRYGPYVTDGETNASIPRGTDPATISLADARSLIDARRGAPPREKRSGRLGKRRAVRSPAVAAEAVVVVAAKTRPTAAPRLKASIKSKSKSKPPRRKILH